MNKVFCLYLSPTVIVTKTLKNVAGQNLSDSTMI